MWNDNWNYLWKKQNTCEDCFWRTGVIAWPGTIHQSLPTNQRHLRTKSFPLPEFLSLLLKKWIATADTAWNPSWNPYQSRNHRLESSGQHLPPFLCFFWLLELTLPPIPLPGSVWTLTPNPAQGVWWVNTTALSPLGWEDSQVHTLCLSPVLSRGGSPFTHSGNWLENTPFVGFLPFVSWFPPPDVSWDHI